MSMTAAPAACESRQMPRQSSCILGCDDDDGSACRAKQSMCEQKLDVALDEAISSSDNMSDVGDPHRTVDTYRHQPSIVESDGFGGSSGSSRHRKYTELSFNDGDFTINNDAVSYGPHNTTLVHANLIDIGTTTTIIDRKQQAAPESLLTSPHESKFAQHLSRQRGQFQQVTSTPMDHKHYNAAFNPLPALTTDTFNVRHAAFEHQEQSLNSIADAYGMTFSAGQLRLPQLAESNENSVGFDFRERKSDSHPRTPVDAKRSNSVTTNRTAASVGSSSSIASHDSVAAEFRSRLDQYERQVAVLTAENAEFRSKADCMTANNNINNTAPANTVAIDPDAEWKLRTQIEKLRARHADEIKYLTEKHSREQEETKRRLPAEGSALIQQLKNECEELKRQLAAVESAASARSATPMVPKALYESDVQRLEQKLRAVEDKNFGLSKKANELESELGKTGKVVIDRLQHELREKKTEISDVWRRYEEAQQQITQLHRSQIENDEVHKKRVADLVADKEDSVVKARDSCLRLHEDTLVQMRVDFRRRLDEERRTIEDGLKGKMLLLEEHANKERDERIKSRKMYLESCDKIDALERELEQLKSAAAARSASDAGSVSSRQSNSKLTANSNGIRSKTARIEQLSNELRESNTENEALQRFTRKLKIQNDRLNRILELRQNITGEPQPLQTDKNKSLTDEANAWRTKYYRLESEFAALQKRFAELQTAHNDTAVVPRTDLDESESRVAQLQVELRLIETDSREAKRRLARVEADEATLAKLREHIVWLETQRDNLKWTKRKLKYFVKARLMHCEECKKYCNFNQRPLQRSAAEITNSNCS